MGGNGMKRRRKPDPPQLIGYRGGHGYCWCPVLDKDTGVWRLCLKEYPAVHHIARKGEDRLEAPANYFPACQHPAGGCHYYWGVHGPGPHAGAEKDNRLVLFSIKILAREANRDQVIELMKGRGYAVPRSLDPNAHGDITLAEVLDYQVAQWRVRLGHVEFNK